MKVQFDGTEYDFDLEEITVAEAKTIKVHCGLTMMSLQQGIGDGDPDAMRALFWLMHVQSGQPVDIDRLDFKLLKFTQALGEAMESETSDDADEDPKGPTEPETASPLT